MPVCLYGCIAACLCAWMPVWLYAYMVVCLYVCMPVCLHACMVVWLFCFDLVSVSVSVSAFWFRSSGWLSVMMTITVCWLFCLVLFWLNCFGLNRWTVLIYMNWVDLTSLWTEMIDSIWFWLDLIWFDWLSRLSILCAVSVFFRVCSVSAIISISTSILGGVVLLSPVFTFNSNFLTVY